MRLRDHGPSEFYPLGILVVATIVAWLVIILGPLPAHGDEITVPGYSATQAARADEIGVTGPTTVKVGEEVVLRLTGMPPVDLDKPLLPQLGWLMGPDQMFCYWTAPGKAMEPLVVRGEIVFGGTGATVEPMIRVRCMVPGEHRLIVDWNYGQNQLVEHRVQAGPGPDPPIPPTPDPPVPPGEKWVIVVEESKDRTLAIGDLMSDRPFHAYLESKNHKWRLVDKDDKTAEWLPSYQKILAQQGIALPALIIADRSSDGDVEPYVCPLPKTAAEVLEVLKEHGG